MKKKKILGRPEDHAQYQAVSDAILFFMTVLLVRVTTVEEEEIRPEDHTQYCKEKRLVRPEDHAQYLYQAAPSPPRLPPDGAFASLPVYQSTRPLSDETPVS